MCRNCSASHVSASVFCLSCVVLRRRPGILVLINDTDWELEGGLDATCTDGDVLVFISTLHGG